MSLWLCGKQTSIKFEKILKCPFSCFSELNPWAFWFDWNFVFSHWHLNKKAFTQGSPKENIWSWDWKCYLPPNNVFEPLTILNFWKKILNLFYPEIIFFFFSELLASWESNALRALLINVMRGCGLQLMKSYYLSRILYYSIYLWNLSIFFPSLISAIYIGRWHILL